MCPVSIHTLPVQKSKMSKIFDTIGIAMHEIDVKCPHFKINTLLTSRQIQPNYNASQANTIMLQLNKEQLTLLK
jgi:hypothetical protein